jgi:hypothetical protein
MASNAGSGRDGGEEDKAEGAVKGGLTAWQLPHRASTAGDGEDDGGWR